MSLHKACRRTTRSFIDDRYVGVFPQLGFERFDHFDAFFAVGLAGGYFCCQSVTYQQIPVRLTRSVIGLVFVNSDAAFGYRFQKRPDACRLLGNRQCRDLL